MVGALLITVAISGSWWLGQRDPGPPPGRWLVAASDLPPGHVLERGDLVERAAHLPDELGDRAFDARDLAVLDGRSILGPLVEGELLQAGAVGADAAPHAARELSLRVDAAWALGGHLAAGEEVDLLVTYGEGEGSSTSRVLAGAVLRSVQTLGGDGLLGGASVVITVAVEDADRILAVTNAARAGALTVVRATGADPVDHDRSHRPDLGRQRTEGGS